MCPSCLSGGLGPGYWAAFAICALFFITAGAALYWASKTGRLSAGEESKYKMLEDQE